MFSEDGKDSPPSGEARNYDEIIGNLLRISYCDGHWNRFFETNGLSPYRIVYEDFVKDYDGTLKRLFDHLGYPSAKIVPPRLKRQSSAYTEEVLAWFIKEHREKMKRPS